MPAKSNVPQDKARVLIVGAGPTGLSAARFLNELGVHSRLVEKELERAPYSKAFAVNPRSLSLLAPSGMTDQLLANGRIMERFHLWHSGRIRVTNEFSKA